MKKHPQKNKKPNTSEILKASERIPRRAADGPEVVKAADGIQGNQDQKPDGIQADGIQKKTRAKAAENITRNARSHEATQQKPHRATERTQAEQIHTGSPKRQHGANYKAADKRRTKDRKQPEKLNFPKILCDRSFWEANFSPPSKNFQASYRDTLGGIKKFCNISGKIFKNNFSLKP